MRYSGGLMGGSWMTALAGDLGAGVFDGAALVQNFEAQNPANTLWTKRSNLSSKIDAEPERYLEFEKWWGGHITLNAEEMQWIVDELFVGNHLAAGDIRTPDGTAVDLRSIRSPIVVFCSKGDNITPPQQALDSILDLYDSVDDIRAWGQTIVYTVHERVGHLGILKMPRWPTIYSLDGVDDGLAPGADVVDAVVEVERTPSSACCGVMLSPLEQNTTMASGSSAGQQQCRRVRTGREVVADEGLVDDPLHLHQAFRRDVTTRRFSNWRRFRLGVDLGPEVVCFGPEGVAQGSCALEVLSTRAAPSKMPCAEVAASAVIHEPHQAAGIAHQVPTAHAGPVGSSIPAMMIGPKRSDGALRERIIAASRPGSCR